MVSHLTAEFKKFQVGKGNELIPADLTVGSDVTADVEKGISMKLGGSGTVTIHAGLCSSDAMCSSCLSSQHNY